MYRGGHIHYKNNVYNNVCWANGAFFAVQDDKSLLARFNEIAKCDLQQRVGEQIGHMEELRGRESRMTTSVFSDVVSVFEEVDAFDLKKV